MHSKKKLTILAAALVCLLLLPVLVSADPIIVGVTNVSLTRDVSNTWNGPFKADINNNGTTDFLTFCVEGAELFNLSTPYTITGLGTAVVQGLPYKLSTQSLQHETAWLYRQFLDGAIQLTSNPQRDAFQAAIYKLQGLNVGSETIVNNFDVNHLGNWIVYHNSKFIQTSYGFFDVHETALGFYNQYLGMVPNASNLSGYYGVAVMNLGTANQDMLCPVPLPGAVLLLGAGLARLAAYARRRKEA